MRYFMPLLAAAALIAMFSVGPAAAQEAAGHDLSRVRPGMEKEYRDARKAEAKANEDLARSRADADRARVTLLEGERLAADSAKALAAQQTAYKAFATRVGSATSAKAIDAEIESLKGIAKLWGQAESGQKEGLKLIKQAQKDIGKSQERQVKAESKLARARAELATAVHPEPVNPEPVDLLGGGDLADAPSEF